jgi:putative SOS response-associated peptidase YedK
LLSTCDAERIAVHRAERVQLFFLVALVEHVHRHGIWENWRNADGEWERTFCIITVPANELVGAVHDLMPAIIPIVEHPRWLGPDPDPRDLLKPYPARLMKRIPKLPKRR